MDANMPTQILSGVGVALITPFDSQNKIDFKALEKIVEYTTNQGVDFLVVMGTTGESPTLSEEEKKDVCQAVINYNHQRLPIVLGIGGNDTASVGKKCEFMPMGVDYVLSVVPYYNKPCQEGIFQHFKYIANASPKPIIVYNIPSRTGVNVNPSTIIRLSEDVQGIIAVKEASGSLSQISEIIANRKKGFSVLSGDDSMTFPLLCLGGDGVISTSANAFSNVFKQIIKNVKEGNIEEARKWHYKALPLMKLFFEEGNPSGIKAGMSELGLCKNILRLPLVSVSSDLKSRIAEALKEL